MRSIKENGRRLKHFLEERHCKLFVFDIVDVFRCRCLFPQGVGSNYSFCWYVVFDELVRVDDEMFQSLLVN